MRRSSGSKHVRQRTYRYVDSGDMHESIDAFGREFSGPYDDRTISVYNGKFIPLAVHCTADVLRGSGGATWTRKSIKPIGHSTYKLSEWVLSDPGWRVCMRTLAAFPLMMVRV